MSYAYYRFFPGDYIRDTVHLGWLEDCAYRRLIDLYQLHGKPIRNDRSYILRAVRAFEPEQQSAVDNVLSEFFILKADGWHQTRCDAEVRYRTNLSDAGKRAVNAREKKRENKDIRTPDDRSMIGRLTNQNQNQNQNQKDSVVVDVIDISKNKAKPKNLAQAPFVIPDWIPKMQWDAWVEARTKKRNPPTAFALRMAVTKLEYLQRDGHHPAAVLAQSAFHGWASLYPIKETQR